MECKNLKSQKIKLVLLDIFPSLVDLKNQDKQGLSIIFHGINMFYDLEELITQKKEVEITPNQMKIKITMSIIKTTDIIASGQMLIKQGTQWVTFLYENKEKPNSGNLALNLIDCIKINIFCDILNKNNPKKRNNSIEFPEKTDLLNKLNKKSLDNFQKILKKNNINKNNNNSEEYFNGGLMETCSNVNTTNKKKELNDYDNQASSSISKEYNKKFDINNTNINSNYNTNNTLSNSINFLYKEFNNNNFCALKKLKTQTNTNNKKFKKRANNSQINISGIEYKTLNYSNLNLNTSVNKSKNNSKQKLTNSKEENNFFSFTLKNFKDNKNRLNNNFYKKYLSTSENENNPNFQNYSINIDELLSNKITEHVNMAGNKFKSGFLEKNNFKKIDNYNNNGNLYKNKLIHSKTKTSNFINVNVKVNELYRAKNGDSKNKKSKNKFNKVNINKAYSNSKYTTNNYISYMNNKNNKSKNILGLEISTNSLMEETEKSRKTFTKDRSEDKEMTTKNDKKIIFNQENILEPNTISVHKTNKSQCYIATYDKSTTYDKSYEQTNRDNEIDKDDEDEYNNYNKLKEDFILVYNDEYIKNIQEDLLKLEIELFIEKITELIKEYHAQIVIKNMEHQILQNDYNNNVKNYLYQWKLNNKLKYIKEYHESKKINPFEDKKQIDKNKISKININQKEIVIFKTLFNDNKDDINKYQEIITNNKKILKNIILNTLGKCNKDDLNTLVNSKYKKWIEENMNIFPK